MGRADHRADDGRLVERIIHLDALRAKGELGHEVGVDAPLHQDAAARGAAFAGVRKEQEKGRIQRAGPIGIVEDHGAELADELGAFRCRQAGPFRKGGLRGSHRGVDLVGTAGGDLREHLLRGRVDGPEVVAAGLLLATDQVVDSHAMGRGDSNDGRGRFDSCARATDGVSGSTHMLGMQPGPGRATPASRDARSRKGRRAAPVAVQGAAIKRTARPARCWLKSCSPTHRHPRSRSRPSPRPGS